MEMGVKFLQRAISFFATQIDEAVVHYRGSGARLNCICSFTRAIRNVSKWAFCWAIGPANSKLSSSVLYSWIQHDFVLGL